MALWDRLNDTIKWGRLYGGAIGVIMIDGQDMSSPLRMETVGPGAFRGVMVLDRWMVTPTTQDRVTDMGPDFGTPKFYQVVTTATDPRGKSTTAGSFVSTASRCLISRC